MKNHLQNNVEYVYKHNNNPMRYYTKYANVQAVYNQFISHVQSNGYSYHFNIVQDHKKRIIATNFVQCEICKYKYQVNFHKTCTLQDCNISLDNIKKQKIKFILISIFQLLLAATISWLMHIIIRWGENQNKTDFQSVQFVCVIIGVVFFVAFALIIAFYVFWQYFISAKLQIKHITHIIQKQTNMTNNQSFISTNVQNFQYKIIQSNILPQQTINRKKTSQKRINRIKKTTLKAVKNNDLQLSSQSLKIQQLPYPQNNQFTQKKQQYLFQPIYPSELNIQTNKKQLNLLEIRSLSSVII